MAFVDRRTKFKVSMHNKLFHKVLWAFLVLFTYGCHTEPTRDSLIGSWESSDGCEIVLNEDSTCFVKDLDLSKLFKESNDTCLTFMGTWKYRRQNDLGDKEYNIVIREDSMYLYIPLSISGHGICGNKPPWYLYQSIGDPDEMNQYKFVKSSCRQLTSDLIKIPYQ